MQRYFRNKCPQLGGNNSKNEKDKVLYYAYMAQEKSNEWYIDPGATADMTHERVVKNLVKSKRCMSHVLAADGKKMDIIGIGTMKKVTTTNKVLELNDVQVIP